MSSYLLVHPGGMDPFLSRLPAQFHDNRECWGDDRDLAIRFSDRREAEGKAALKAKGFGDGVVRVDTDEHPEIEAALTRCFMGDMEALPVIDQYYQQYGIVSLKYFAARALFGTPSSRRMLSGSFSGVYWSWQR
jgi:hypothetical protein